MGLLPSPHHHHKLKVKVTLNSMLCATLISTQFNVHMPKRKASRLNVINRIFIYRCFTTKCEDAELKTGPRWKFSAHNNFEWIALYWHGGRWYCRAVVFKKKKKNTEIYCLYGSETLIYVKCLSCENVRTSSLPSLFKVLGGRDAISRPGEEKMASSPGAQCQQSSSHHSALPVQSSQSQFCYTFVCSWT